MLTLVIILHSNLLSCIFES